MSNLRLSGSSPVINKPISTSTPTVSPATEKQPSAPLKTIQAPPKPQKSMVGTAQETTVIHKEIDEMPSADIKERVSKVPTIDALQQAKSKLKTPTNVRDTSQGLAAFAKKEFVNDTTSAQSSKVESKAVEHIHETLSDRALANKLKSLESETLVKARSTFAMSLQNGRRNLDAQLNQGLGQVLAPYEKKTNALIGSKTSNSAETELANQVKSWVQDQGKNSDVVLSIQNMSASEVDQMATGLLKDLKGYSDKDMQKLSDRKQAFIRVVSENLQEGAKTASNTARGSRSIHNAMNTIKQEYAATVKNEGGLNSQLGRELMLRSDENILGVMNADSSQTNKLLQKSVLQGINQGLGGKVSEQTVTLQATDGPIESPAQIDINGESYGQPKFLAAGGFANIVAYTNVNNPEDQIVLKQLKDDGSRPQLELRAEAAEEILGQIEIEGKNGHPNINPLVGTIRGENEQLYIIQDMAKGGSLQGTRDNLWELQEQNILPKDVRQLLGAHLVKGTLQGMEHIQNERQGHHFDLKLPNVLLGGDGQAKITDFGLSGLGNTRSAENLKENSNAIYQSPEFHDQSYEKGAINYSLKKQGLKTFDLYPVYLNGSKPLMPPTFPEEPADLSSLSEDKQERYHAKVAEYDQDVIDYPDKLEYIQNYQTAKADDLGNPDISNRADNWNAGIMAYDLLKGDSSTTDLYNSTNWFGQSVSKYGENEDNRMAPASRIGGKTGEMGIGISSVDKMINGLMHVDPEKRTNFKETLNNSLFKDERLDKPEVGQLLLKISQIDPKNLSAQDKSEIEQLANALKA